MIIQSHPKRLAIGQFEMRWSCEENTETILAAIRSAADRGANICVFPELGITGFHRKIGTQAQAEIVDFSLESIRAACAERSIAVAVGAPTFGVDGDIFNSYIHIGECGEILAITPKNGLTPSEETFFKPGVSRPVSQMASLRCASVLCREVEDLESIQGQLPASSVDIIFWPSLVGRPPKSPLDPEEINYLPLAQSLARQSQAYVVQANWPNSLNYPEEGTHAGESVVVAPNGEVLLTLPRAEAGVAIFALGERTFQWLPEKV